MQLLRYHERMRVVDQLLEQHGDSDMSSTNTSESSSVHPPSSSSKSLYPPSDYSNSASTTDASTTYYIGDASSGSSSRSNQYATTIDDWWTSIWTREELAAMDAEAELEDQSINAITTDKLHEVIRAQIDTRTDATVTNRIDLLHNYRPYTDKFKCPV